MTTGERMLFAVAFEAELHRQATDNMDPSPTIAASVAAGSVLALRSAQHAAHHPSADVADDTRAMLDDMIGVAR